MDLKNKVALVTGAGKGIGRAISLELARAGANIVVVSRSMNDLQSLAREIGDLGRKAFPVEADVTRESRIREFVKLPVERFGSFDILVNNAGLGRFGRVEDLSTQDWDDMYEVNLRAMFLCIREALPFLKRKPESVIVNMASLAGKNAFVGGGGYAASKWGVLALSKCLMLEERQNGVRVMAICPGSVHTQFFKHESLPNPDKEKILRAEDVARVTVDAIQLPQHATVSELEIRPTNP